MLKCEEDISLIKYDLEGTEVDALDGSTKIIEKHRPVLLIEVNQHCQNLHNSSVKELFKWLIANNYYILIEEEEKKWSRLKEEDHEKFPEMTVKDIVAVPCEKILNYDCECGKCFNFQYIK